MRHLALTFFSIMVLTLLSLPAVALAETAPAMKTLLDQQLATNSHRYGIVGQSVFILKNHQPLYRGQHGFANLELDVAISNKHIFPSYSVAKLLTSVVVMQQVESGNIALAGSIRTYLPYLPKHWQDVTVEHLLSHTSGIPRYFDMAMESRRFLANKKAIFLSLVEQPEHFKMATENRYNNTNFLLLSAILETVTGLPYRELVTEHIIKPLGLKNTGYSSAKNIVKNMVSSYRGNQGDIRRNINIDWPEYTFAHSALYSTPEDLTSFMTALVTGKFVSQEALDKLWQPMKLSDGKLGRYAFGFEYGLEDGYYQVGHDGGNQVKLRHYFSTEDTADNYTLAYLTNGNANGVWTDVLAESLMSIVAPKSFEMAVLKDQFISDILTKDDIGLTKTYHAIAKAFDNDQTLIEDFIRYRAYALRYGSGVASSVPAFEFISEKFPHSTRAQKNLAEIRTLLD